MIRGVLSIGTNSTRALAVSFEDGVARTVLARSTGTRIGEGIKERGRLDPDAVERTLKALREHAEAVRKLTDDVRVIATSALRRAQDGEAFAAAVSAVAGAQLRIISGEDEARLSYLGAVSGVAHGSNSTFGVLDTGGGSSEYAVGSAQPERIVSCEIGAVRLTESVPQLAGRGGPVGDAALEDARAHIRSAIEPIAAFPHAGQLIVVGGTATTAVAMVNGRREMFEYAPLTVQQIELLVRRLCGESLEARKVLPGMNPQRADILLGGLLILEAVYRCTGHDRALVSTNDLLLGTLLV